MTEVAAAVSLTPPDEARALAEGRHADPHHVLGVHRYGRRTVLRAWYPGTTTVEAQFPDGDTVALQPDPAAAGLFSAEVPADTTEYRLRATAGQWHDDPYRYWPVPGDVDLHLLGEGRHRRLWERLGAIPIRHHDTDGVVFTLWAPSARAVLLVGDVNGWNERKHPMRKLAESGLWELFVPAARPGDHYRFDVLGADGVRRAKADPMARWGDVPPGRASRVAGTQFTWSDAEWLATRDATPPEANRLSIYEVHLGSWRRSSDGGVMGYAEAASQLVAHVVNHGFTHVELMPVAEHPFGGSWGYQVSGYYAPSARWGSPDDLRLLIDRCHSAGIGVIVDWVPAHFPRDDWALARFDGTSLYEHDDPRQGEHPDWGTLIFNFGRHEVRNFLIANALYWIEEFHVDGYRVDAVASMLYLDYSREAGQWVPNAQGGRENLEAIAFLQELNQAVAEAHPGVLRIAEESTAWGGVTAPVADGGLGFTHKWNMGWMHDTLDYFERESIHRQWHHHQLTFGMIYAYSERFILPLSHDEVVHLKGSLWHKMPGDDWQKLANLRALYGWMWGFPGGQLLFMGAEVGQRHEWSESGEVHWNQLDDPRHAGLSRMVRDLNLTQRGEPALWRGNDNPDGFDWIEADATAESIYAFLRRDPYGDGEVLCVANLTPVPRDAHRLGVPEGTWTRLLDTDDAVYGGSGWGAGREPVRTTEAIHWGGRPTSATFWLPPLAVTFWRRTA